MMPPSMLIEKTHDRSAEESKMTIFTKIINREIPAQIVFEDEKCLAFKDVNPQAPVHVLLIPKKEIPTLNDLSAIDAELMGHMMLRVPEIAKQLGLADLGYRTVVNTNAQAGQTVFHIHIHILGGRAMGWPPG
jgi:histidine triad (HIT) family protein